jgi:hypothetical protein
MFIYEYVYTMNTWILKMIENVFSSVIIVGKNLVVKKFLIIYAFRCFFFC